MSALAPKADIRQRIEHVRFVPEADIHVLHVLHVLLLHDNANTGHCDGCSLLCQRSGGGNNKISSRSTRSRFNASWRRQPRSFCCWMPWFCCSEPRSVHTVRGSPSYSADTGLFRKSTQF